MIEESSWQKMAAEAGILLIMPAVYLIISSLFEGAGFPMLYDAGIWLLSEIGLQQQFRLVHALIIFGPVVASLLNVYAVASFNWERTRHDVMFGLSLKKSYFNWTMLLLSLVCLIVLLLLFLKAKCNCG